MNRSTFILGISLLVVAVTMAVTITVRNAPEEAADAKITAQKARNHGFGKASGRSAGRMLRASGGSRLARRPLPRVQYEVVIPEDRLMAFPASRQEELRKRVALVERKARKQLERMTGEFDLTTAQRRKMFPLLVRSTPGYDPVMQVAGIAAPVNPDSAPDEEIHALLDPEQQAELEEEEVNRRLWWQDLIGRLEKELVDSTGGAQVPAPDTETGTPPAPDPAAPAPGGTQAPPARPTGNLLELGQ